MRKIPRLPGNQDSNKEAKAMGKVKKVLLVGLIVSIVAVLISSLTLVARLARVMKRMLG